MKRRPPASWTTSRRPGCATTSARSTRPSRSTRSSSADGTDADVFALADDELEAAVQVFHVRGGRIRGQRGWVVEKESRGHRPSSSSTCSSRSTATQSARAACRARSSSRSLPADARGRSPHWLSGLRGAAGRPAGAAARRQAGADGDGPPQRRAVPGPAQGRPRRRPDRPQPGAAGAAGGPRAARRAAADRVLRRQPRPGHQRRRVDGRLRGRPGRASPSTAGSSSGATTRDRADGTDDDTAAMHEVLTRRFRRYLDDARRDSTEIELRRPADDRGRLLGRDDGDAARPRPDRPGHRAAAQVRLPAQPRRRRRRPAAGQRGPARSLDELGIDDVALVGLAKRLEEVWLPGQDFPVILPRTSEGLYLLQRVRDEAHRFAITFHRQRRSKAMTTSSPRRDPGPRARRGARRCCGIRLGQAASRGVGRGDRRGSRASGRPWPTTIATRLARGASAAVPAVNVTTGEVLD